MIIEHICQGSEATSYHTFNFTTQGMSVILSNGAYYRNGTVLISSDSEVRIDIPVSSKDMEYSIYLTTDGITVVEQDLTDYAFIQVDGLIDKLAWFIVPANVTSLDNVEVNVKYVNLM